MNEFKYLGMRYDEPIKFGLDSKMLPAFFPQRPGDKLPNGAILLEETELRRFDHRRDSIVFCVIPKSHSPFVSWIRCITTDSPLATGGYQVVDTCSWGVYYTRFLDVQDALNAFHERVEAKVAMFDHSGNLVS